MKKITLLFSSLVLCMITAFGQYTPTLAIPLAVSENAGVSVTDYAVNIVINTAAEVNAGHMAADGRDIRFSEQMCDTVFYHYWIESGMNTVATSFWVLLPSLPANGSANFFLLSGDSSVTAVSDFDSVFTNPIITGGTNISLTGVQTPDWLQVDAGDTLFISSGTILDISARKAVINGVIFGAGSGYQAALTGPATGPGTSGGTAGTSSGSGGGAYGGNGGTGGYDNGDPINLGGTAYGTNNGTDLDMGSAGGSSDNTIGGSGGGAIMLTAEFISVTGEINVNGGSGPNPGGSRGGGGGAGGGILLIGDHIDFSGTMAANGGNGTIGTSSANDDGGGGSGGRIKVYYDNILANTGTHSVTGGAPGLNGDILPTAGGNGSWHDTAVAFNAAVVVFGSPVFLPLDTSVTKQAGTLTANQSGVTYQWLDCDNGNQPIPGETGQSFSPANGGNYAVEITLNGCTATSACHEFTFLALEEAGKEVFTVFPNPATNILSVRHTPSSSGATVRLIDVQGRTVLQQVLSGPETLLMIHHLEAGMYLVTLTDGSVSLGTTRIIKY